MKTFPFPIAIDANETSQYQVNKVQFGDGYAQVSSTGINNRKRAWNCSCIDSKAVIDAVKDFLNSTLGVEAFRFRPVPSEPFLTVRLSGEVTRSQIGADVWRIGFAVEQVF